jgi:hypothetical protein
MPDQSYTDEQRVYTGTDSEGDALVQAVSKADDWLSGPACSTAEPECEACQ